MTKDILIGLLAVVVLSQQVLVHMQRPVILRAFELIESHLENIWGRN